MKKDSGEETMETGNALEAGRAPTGAPEIAARTQDPSDVNVITGAVVDATISVSNALGPGFLEKVYENALAYELNKRGFNARQQERISVVYEGHIVGDYIADILVSRQVLVEVKAVRALDDSHMAQCINYLRATGLKVCMLINFGGKKAEYRRIVNGL